MFPGCRPAGRLAGKNRRQFAHRQQHKQYLYAKQKEQTTMNNKDH